MIVEPNKDPRAMHHPMNDFGFPQSQIGQQLNESRQSSSKGPSDRVLRSGKTKKQSRQHSSSSERDKSSKRRKDKKQQIKKIEK